MPNADTRVETPRDRRIAVPEGERQYHIGLGPGDLAEYVLLPGDQDRTSRIASRFDSIEREHRHREFASATGTYKGQRVSVVSTGIGTASSSRRGGPPSGAWRRPFGSSGRVEPIMGTAWQAPCQPVVPSSAASAWARGGLRGRSRQIRPAARQSLPGQSQNRWPNRSALVRR